MLSALTVERADEIAVRDVREAVSHVDLISGATMSPCGS
jgi:hypothetical protein